MHTTTKTGSKIDEMNFASTTTPRASTPFFNNDNTSNCTAAERTLCYQLLIGYNILQSKTSSIHNIYMNSIIGQLGVDISITPNEQ